MQTCKYCRKEIPDDASYCVHHCGKDQRPEKQGSFSASKIIVGSIAFIAIVVSCVFLFRSIGTKPPPPPPPDDSQDNNRESLEDEKKQFDSLLKKNKSKLLFLSFWDGMTQEETDLAERVLISDSLLSKDVITFEARDTTTSWVDKSCNEKSSLPYFIFNFPEFKVKAEILPEIDSIEGGLTSLTLFLVHSYNFRYYIGEMPMKDCTVPNAYADAVVKVYSNKYGVPTISTESYPVVYEKKYSWNLSDRVIEISKFISKTNLDHKKLPILESCNIEYFNKETRSRINMRQKSQKQKEHDQRQKKQRKTEQSI